MDHEGSWIDNRKGHTNDETRKLIRCLYTCDSVREDSVKFLHFCDGEWGGLCREAFVERARRCFGLSAEQVAILCNNRVARPVKGNKRQGRR